MRRNALEKQIQAVRETLQRLDRELRGLVPAIANAVAVATSNGMAPPRRKPQLSPERRRALKIHGQYLGHIRLLMPAQKAQVKAAKAKGGYRAAIALAKRLGER